MVQMCIEVILYLSNPASWILSELNLRYTSKTAKKKTGNITVLYYDPVTFKHVYINTHICLHQSTPYIYIHEYIKITGYHWN